jgi:type IV pilus assembly protein PilC
MPKFAYVAVGPDGRTVSGVHTDKSLTQAEQSLSAQALRLTKLEQKPSILDFEITASRIKPSDLMHFSRQLSAFLKAGIPILDALAVLAAETDRAAVKRVLVEISEDLRSGARLTEAIDKHPGDFPEWYRGILRSAELTGRLDDVLDQLATYIERDVEARRRLKSALVYPAIIAVMASSCCPSSRTSSPAWTPNCRWPPGCCSRPRASSASGGG